MKEFMPIKITTISNTLKYRKSNQLIESYNIHNITRSTLVSEQITISF